MYRIISQSLVEEYLYRIVIIKYNFAHYIQQQA